MKCVPSSGMVAVRSAWDCKRKGWTNGIEEGHWGEEITPTLLLNHHETLKNYLFPQAIFDPEKVY